MHGSAFGFVASIRRKYPKHFGYCEVLEVGSRNINGSVRELFVECEYLGIDLGPGPGVDMVAHVKDFIQPERFATIVSTEALEHDRFWRKSLLQMYANARRGGLIVVTCAGPNRHEHGTATHNPQDSPETNDYYGNLTIDDIGSVYTREMFSDMHLAYTETQTDLQFYGVKNEGNLSLSNVLRAAGVAGWKLVSVFRGPVVRQPRLACV